jgi:hypothetical protein
MESYRTMNDGYVQRVSDLALIPNTEENADFVQFLADVDAGAEVLPFDYEAEARRQESEAKRLKDGKEAGEVSRDNARSSAIAKFKALGLTDIEINALIGQ